MAWTAPRTWVSGEVVSASYMNAIRDDFQTLVAAGAQLATFARLAYASDSWFGFFAPGSNADVLPPSSVEHWAIPFQTLTPISPRAEWRVSTIFTVSVVVPGSPSALTWTPKLQLESFSGNTTAPPLGQVAFTPVSIANTLTTQAADTGWVSTGTITGLSTRLYRNVARSDRTGGSGAGSAGFCVYFMEIRPGV